MKIAVIGTGYVGLVTGTCLAEVGHDVVCVDIDEKKVASLKKGISPIYEPGLEELIKKNFEDKRLHFTTSLDELNDPAVIFFALPTPPGADGSADLQFVLKAATDVAGTLKKYTVLVNKSTVPVGTAQKVQAKVAEGTTKPFDIVSNPEFLREGFAVRDFLEPDRIVVGAQSEKALAVMREVYEPFTIKGTTLIEMDTASSEMTKYAANSFLATKITFMNEIANICELVGANVDLVKNGIGHDSRIGHKFLNAGIGYGGSCFPKDVLALHKAAEEKQYHFQILSSVMAVNKGQKKVLVNKVLNKFGDNLREKTFALWGLAFKPDTDDIREAPSLEIIKALLEHGARVRVYDPEATENVKNILGDSIEYSANALGALDGANALLLVTEWQEFFEYPLAEIRSHLKDPIVFDGRNAFDPLLMKEAEIDYTSIGR